jgi:hypothetical protein
MEQGVKPIWVVLFVILIAFAAVGGGAYFLWPKVKGFIAKKAESVVTQKTDTAAPPATTTTAATNTAPPKVAEASVNVVTTTSTPPPATTTTQPPTPVLIEEKPPVKTTTVAPPPVQITETVAPPVKKQPPPPRVEEETPPPPPVASSVETYVDGSDDSDTNDRALERARQLLRGVKSVEVHGGSLNQVLLDALKDEVPYIRVADRANVVIRFDGKVEGIGRGRKMREGHGTVTKNGRVVFSYELPNEVYRLGLPPANAFARVLSDVFTEED